MHPALIEIGSVAISSLWFFVALGFLAVGILLIKLSLKNRLKLAFLTQHFFRIILWGLLFSRILYVLLNYEEYFLDFTWTEFLNVLTIWDKGFEFWGMAAGVIYAFYRYTKKEQESFLAWIDMLSLSLMGGLILGNIGAFLEGINYGHETDLPWGVTYQNFAVPYTIPVHPSQLYAVIYTSVIFGIFLTLFLKEKMKEPGDITYWMILSYSALRFMEEFTRGEETWIFLDLRFGQWIALSGIIFAGIMLILRYNKGHEIP